MSKADPSDAPGTPDPGPGIVRAIGIYHLVLAAICVVVLIFVWVGDPRDVATRPLGVASLLILVASGLGLMRWQRWAYVVALGALGIDVVWYLAVAISRAESVGGAAISIALLPVGVFPVLPVLLLLRRDARAWFRGRSWEGEQIRTARP